MSVRIAFLLLWRALQFLSRRESQLLPGPHTQSHRESQERPITVLHSFDYSIGSWWDYCIVQCVLVVGFMWSSPSFCCWWWYLLYTWSWCFEWCQSEPSLLLQFSISDWHKQWVPLDHQLLLSCCWWWMGVSFFCAGAFCSFNCFLFMHDFEFCLPGITQKLLSQKLSPKRSLIFDGPST